MEKNSLYLSDEQIWDCASRVHKRWADPPMTGDSQYEEFRIETEQEISKASADYAVKKVIEWLEGRAFTDKNYRVWGQRLLISEEWRTLDKLIEG